jgi:hypothetical protein
MGLNPKTSREKKEKKEKRQRIRYIIYVKILSKGATIVVAAMWLAKRKRDSKLLWTATKNLSTTGAQPIITYLNINLISTQSSSYLRGGLLSEGILLLSTLFLSTMAVAVPGSITALMKNLLIGCVANVAPVFFFLPASASAFFYSFYFCLPLLSLTTTTTSAPVVTVPATIFDVLLLYYYFYCYICICYY